MECFPSYTCEQGSKRSEPTSRLCAQPEKGGPKQELEDAPGGGGGNTGGDKPVVKEKGGMEEMRGRHGKQRRRGIRVG